MDTVPQASGVDEIYVESFYIDLVYPAAVRMPTLFVGRSAELNLLRKRLDRITATGSAAAVAIRGRRQVGKSRLVQEFCDRAGVPYLFFTATKGASPVEAVSSFLTELRESALPVERELVPDDGSIGWPDALRVLAAVLPAEPCVIVMDELPWLAEQDAVFDGALQTAWDRLLSRRPVLLLLLGSDLHMMERLTAYDRPFYGRADNLVLGPLNPAETGDALGLGPADAIDAHLVSGGLPGIIRAWPHGTPALDFIQAECADPASPLFGIPETSLMAEFPAPDQSRRVLEAVGSGDRTHANIAATAGSQGRPLPSGVLSPLLRRLAEEKRILATDNPLSVKPGKPALYRVADSNLRLYLAALRAAQEQSRRGRPEAAFRTVQRRWTTWRGRAVEPLVREALELAALAGELPWPEAEAVGGWWNRQFSPEIDIIGADRSPVARQLFFAGSIKWLGTPFDRRDLAELHQGAAQVPGFAPGSTGLVAVSLSGTEDGLGPTVLDLTWGPREVVAAWAP
ncbi:hypothetical protein GCM10020367_52730 [Streptomyces sannanensis]|uniref:ATP-binding protein n=1 Tax=Streptomyces sannanensis TaxID=285536 RepID=A0ABP6SIK5_9ACTN